MDEMSSDQQTVKPYGDVAHRNQLFDMAFGQEARDVDTQSVDWTFDKKADFSTLMQLGDMQKAGVSYEELVIKHPQIAYYAQPKGETKKRLAAAENESNLTLEQRNDLINAYQADTESLSEFRTKFGVDSAIYQSWYEQCVKRWGQEPVSEALNISEQVG